MILPRVFVSIVALIAGVFLVLRGERAFAERPQLQMLGQLQDGRWELRRYDGGAVQRLCVKDRFRLIQLRHPDLKCDRIVLEDAPGSVTVQYTCRGRGYGRTHIRRESGQLIQLETQGIADGLPYEFSAEGRRVGECSTQG